MLKKEVVGEGRGRQVCLHKKYVSQEICVGGDIVSRGYCVEVHLFQLVNMLVQNTYKLNIFPMSGCVSTFVDSHLQRDKNEGRGGVERRVIKVS
jgi:hypothetical protein